MVVGGTAAAVTLVTALAALVAFSFVGLMATAGVVIVGLIRALAAVLGVVLRLRVRQ